MVDERSKAKTARVLSITPSQLRAARALLDWTRSDCARISGLSPETIKNIEHGVFAPTQETLERILSAFSGHGVEFFIQQSSFTLHGVAVKTEAAAANAEENPHNEAHKK